MAWPFELVCRAHIRCQTQVRGSVLKVFSYIIIGDTEGSVTPICLLLLKTFRLLVQTIRSSTGLNNLFFCHFRHKNKIILSINKDEDSCCYFVCLFVGFFSCFLDSFLVLYYTARTGQTYIARERSNRILTILLFSCILIL